MGMGACGCDGRGMEGVGQGCMRLCRGLWPVMAAMECPLQAPHRTHQLNTAPSRKGGPPGFSSVGSSAAGEEP